LRKIVISLLISLFVLPVLVSSVCLAADTKAISAINAVLHNNKEQHGYRFSANQLKEIIDADIQPVIVDIRSTKSFSEGHILGANHIPLWSLVETIEKNTARLPMDHPIYVICCQKDIFAAYAVMVLRMGGYDAYLIPGGMPQWGELGYPIEQGAVEGKNTDRSLQQVHLPNIKNMQQADSFIQGIPQNKSYQLHLQDLREDEKNQRSFSAIDVRLEGQNTRELLSGAQRIPLNRLVDVLQKNPLLISKEKPVIVVDTLDSQAAFAVLALRLLGYEAYMIPSEELLQDTKSI
jgi:rhodanese-related sulfurtransferase